MSRWLQSLNKFINRKMKCTWKSSINLLQKKWHDTSFRKSIALRWRSLSTIAFFRRHLLWPLSQSLSIPTPRPKHSPRNASPATQRNSADSLCADILRQENQKTPTPTVNSKCIWKFERCAQVLNLTIFPPRQSKLLAKQLSIVTFVVGQIYKICHRNSALCFAGGAASSSLKFVAGIVFIFDFEAPLGRVSVRCFDEFIFRPVSMYLHTEKKRPTTRQR